MTSRWARESFRMDAKWSIEENRSNCSYFLQDGGNDSGFNATQLIPSK